MLLSEEQVVECFQIVQATLPGEPEELDDPAWLATCRQALSQAIARYGACECGRCFIADNGHWQYILDEKCPEGQAAHCIAHAKFCPACGRSLEVRHAAE